MELKREYFILGPYRDRESSQIRPEPRASRVCDVPPHAAQPSRQYSHVYDCTCMMATSSNDSIAESESTTSKSTTHTDLLSVLRCPKASELARKLENNRMKCENNR